MSTILSHQLQKIVKSERGQSWNPQITKFLNCRGNITDSTGPSQYKDVILPYTNSHYKDKTVSQPSYLYNWNPHTWKDVLYTETGPRAFLIWSFIHGLNWSNLMKRGMGSLLQGLFLIPARLSNHKAVKSGMKLFIYSKTSTVVPLKLGNG